MPKLEPQCSVLEFLSGYWAIIWHYCVVKLIVTIFSHIENEIEFGFM
jgi:hypothetical protein